MWTRCGAAWAQTPAWIALPFPGIGYGGSCFPKDVQALHKSGEQADFDFGILTSVMRANDAQKTILFDPLRDYFKGDLKGKKIALWGLAFKPETDDIREAPALYMIDKLTAAGAQVVAFDPEAMDNVRASIGDQVQYASDHMEALDGADALLICTEWQVFRNPNMEDVKSRLAAPVFLTAATCTNWMPCATTGSTTRASVVQRTPRLMERVLITGAAGFWVLTCATASSPRGSRSRPWTTSSPAT